MAYLVLARKYRPQSFDQVIGQGHITRTLINAIASNRVAHAILFSGPRGTGKTTIARILAKAMNCGQGPTSSPCNQCRSCREIVSGNAADVFEIDGASNNSVEQIRDLRENIKYLPANSPYKIYIIDEVHMLSIPAFNALLKTLEEPPPHILFMFATTEPHKIPITILSRCQRHDFRRIEIESIQRHMEMICDKEGVEISPESLFLIGKEAGGSMRDALSLLDQVMTCSDGPVSPDDIVGLLGVTDRTLIFAVSKAVFSGDGASVLRLLDDAYDRGFDMKKLFSDLVEHFRNLMVIKIDEKTHRLVDLPAHEIHQLEHQCREHSAAYLNQNFNLLLTEEAAIRFSAQPKLVLEMILLKMCQIKPVLPVDVLIEKLEDLRTELSDGENKPQTANRHQIERSAEENGAVDNPEPIGKRTTGDVQASEPAENLDRLWERVVEIASDEQPMLGAALTKCSVNGLNEKAIEIAVNGSSFNMNFIHRVKNKTVLERIIHDIMGKKVDLVLKTQTNNESNNQKKKEREHLLKKEALGHPMVAEALEIFNGSILDVKIL